MKFSSYFAGAAIFSVAALGLPFYAGAWSQKGHDTVCFIAQNHLTEASKAAIDSLLDGKSIVYYANWLDNASHTPEYAYSKTWHYKNIDPDETFENAPLLPEGDIIRAINAQTEVLENDAAPREDKVLALKMLIHFLGDIHQPLHMGHRSDRGGNSHHVKFFKKPTNLHSVWDQDLLEAGHRWSHTEWAREIDRISPDETMMILAADSPEKWGEESYLIATAVYASTPQDSAISYDYIALWTPTVENQILKGGLRLAHLLNLIFDRDYQMPELIGKETNILNNK